MQKKLKFFGLLGLIRGENDLPAFKRERDWTDNQKAKLVKYMLAADILSSEVIAERLGRDETDFPEFAKPFYQVKTHGCIARFLKKFGFKVSDLQLKVCIFNDTCPVSDNPVSKAAKACFDSILLKEFNITRRLKKNLIQCFYPDLDVLIEKKINRVDSAYVAEHPVMICLHRAKTMMCKMGSFDTNKAGLLNDLGDLIQNIHYFLNFSRDDGSLSYEEANALVAVSRKLKRVYFEGKKAIKDKSIIEERRQLCENITSFKKGLIDLIVLAIRSDIRTDLGGDKCINTDDLLNAFNHDEKSTVLHDCPRKKDYAETEFAMFMQLVICDLFKSDGLFKSNLFASDGIQAILNQSPKASSGFLKQLLKKGVGKTHSVRSCLFDWMHNNKKDWLFSHFLGKAVPVFEENGGLSLKKSNANSKALAISEQSGIDPLFSGAGVEKSQAILKRIFELIMMLYKLEAFRREILWENQVDKVRGIESTFSRKTHTLVYLTELKTVIEEISKILKQLSEQLSSFPKHIDDVVVGVKNNGHSVINNFNSSLFERHKDFENCCALLCNQHADLILIESDDDKLTFSNQREARPNSILGLCNQLQRLETATKNLTRKSIQSDRTLNTLQLSLNTIQDNLDICRQLYYQGCFSGHWQPNKTVVKLYNILSKETLGCLDYLKTQCFKKNIKQFKPFCRHSLEKLKELTKQLAVDFKGYGKLDDMQTRLMSTKNLFSQLLKIDVDSLIFPAVTSNKQLISDIEIRHSFLKETFILKDACIFLFSLGGIIFSCRLFSVPAIFGSGLSFLSVFAGIVLIFLISIGLFLLCRSLLRLAIFFRLRAAAHVTVNQDKKAMRQPNVAVSPKPTCADDFKTALKYYNGDGVEKNSSKAFQLFLVLAKKGYVKAQYNIACMYKRGIGCQQDKAQALKWYLKVTKTSHAKAYFHAGCLYLDGKATPDNQPNILKALSAFEKSMICLTSYHESNLYDRIIIALKEKLLLLQENIDQDTWRKLTRIYSWMKDMPAFRTIYFEIGLSYHGKRGIRNYKEVISEVKKKGILKDLNQSKSMCKLMKNEPESINIYFQVGLNYYLSEDVDQNFEKAFELFKICADNDLPPAKHMLGEMYYYGIFVKQNYVKAFKWCEAAANQNNSMAAYSVGLMCFDGLGLKNERPNYPHALKFFKKAFKLSVEQNDKRLISDILDALKKAVSVFDKKHYIEGLNELVRICQSVNTIPQAQEILKQSRIASKKLALTFRHQKKSIGLRSYSDSKSESVSSSTKYDSSSDDTDISYQFSKNRIANQRISF